MVMVENVEAFECGTSMNAAAPASSRPAVAAAGASSRPTVPAGAAAQGGASGSDMRSAIRCASLTAQIGARNLEIQRLQRIPASESTSADLRELHDKLKQVELLQLKLGNLKQHPPVLSATENSDDAKLLVLERSLCRAQGKEKQQQQQQQQQPASQTEQTGLGVGPDILRSPKPPAKDGLSLEWASAEQRGGGRPGRWYYWNAKTRESSWADPIQPEFMG
jgi:hypothetical protein